MTVGIDLSSLQGPHRMRGIGYTLINFINNIPKTERKKHTFVFYVYPGNENEDPLKLLDLKNLNYETRELKYLRRVKKKLPGKLRLLTSAANELIQLRDLYFGDSRIRDLRGIDFFLQSDQSQHLPRRGRNLKRGLIIYDIIPYVLEWEYLWSYKTARVRGFSRKAALHVSVRRWLYAYKLKVNTRHANILFAISECTKQDFVKFIGLSPGKVAVTPLGINPPVKEFKEDLILSQYVNTSWGYRKRNLKMDNKIPFILFVGGADKRRKLQDLVAAFNTLRAKGRNLKLVLAGDSMQGPNNIATEESQNALNVSSYQDDIIYMGFVDDQVREWLYNNALAFVFPSKYEGFGLPVLEAMSYGTPVISYDNAATREVAGNCPIYAKDMVELAAAIEKYLPGGSNPTQTERHNNITQANKWSWEQTSRSILSHIAQRKN